MSPTDPGARGDPAHADAPSAWPAIASALAPHLAQAAGEGASPVSVALELAHPGAAGGEPLDCRAWVERSTRTLVFVGAEARTPGGALVAAASAIFRRTGGA